MPDEFSNEEDIDVRAEAALTTEGRRFGSDGQTGQGDSGETAIRNIMPTVIGINGDTSLHIAAGEHINRGLSRTNPDLEQDKKGR